MATGPLYIPRSYGGGAVVAQLQEEIGATDASFAITPTTGWTDIFGNPLGSAGPFTIVIDRFLASVEKILCSAINLSTGVVTVYNSGGFFGRGYDDTTAQGHSPGTSSGVQTCWSSTEAYAANQVAAYLLGTLGGTPSTGNVLKWGTSAPVWGTPTPLGGNPAARLYGVTQNVIPGTSTSTKVTSLSTDGTPAGGMTISSDSIVVPTTGWYEVNWSLQYENGGGGIANSGVYASQIFKTPSGGSPTQIRGFGDTGLVGTTPQRTGSDLIYCTALDALSLYAYQTSGSNAGVCFNGAGMGGQSNYLSASLVSS